MNTRKRLSAACREGSSEDVHRRSNLRKRPKSEYGSKGGSDDRGDSCDLMEENESSSQEEHRQSAESSHHEEGEGPAQTEDAQQEVQNGERTNGILKGIEIITSKRKPILILHKLEHLQGDFHLLLNNVVLPQKESSVPREAAAENAAEDSSGTEESSEPEVVTLPQDNPSENEEDIHLIEDSPTAAIKLESHHTKDKSVQKNGSDFAPKEETEKKISRTEETTEPEDANSENEGEATDETPSAAAGPNVPKAPSTQAQDIDKSSPQENTNENIQNEMEIGAEVEIGVPHQPLKERPPKEDGPRTIICDQAAKAQPSAELDHMALQQLKKEKIKMQIKVLRLQAEYYSLQIKKLSQ